MKNRINIREATLKDYHNVYTWLYYSDFSDFLNELEGINKETIPSFKEFKNGYFKYFFDGTAPEKGRSYIITLNKEDIGHISYTSYHLLEGIAELDIWFKGLSYTGKGFGNKAIKLLLKLLFSKGIHTFIMRPSTKNIPAIKSYKKAGFADKPLELEKYYRNEFINEYGAGDYGEGGDVFLVLEKKVHY